MAYANAIARRAAGELGQHRIARLAHQPASAAADGDGDVGTCLAGEGSGLHGSGPHRRGELRRRLVDSGSLRLGDEFLCCRLDAPAVAPGHLVGCLLAHRAGIGISGAFGDQQPLVRVPAPRNRRGDRLDHVPVRDHETRSDDPPGTDVLAIEIDAADGRQDALEIGFTWYAERVQRTAVNTEANAIFQAGLESFYGPMSAEQRREYLDQQLRLQPAALLKSE